MRKFLLIVGIILLSLPQIFSEELEKEAVIFEKYEQSVVYIDQALYFDSKNVDNLELFKRVEEKYEVTILDQYFTLSSGTGFFVTKDGYIITNEHVVAQEKLDEIRKTMYRTLINEFFSKIPESVVSSGEYRELKEDVRSLIYNSSFSYRVLVNNSDSFEAKLQQSDEELDVALLKVKSDETFKPIPFGDSDSLKVGNFIMAIGYPVPGSLFQAVKDFKSSMTSGRVSAIRSDNWGIQHTSSISPGNSGGPLFNSRGEVIGINVGAVTTGNDLFFSIPISKALKWLEKGRYSDVIVQNREEARGLGKKYSLNDTGEMEIGETILVNLSEGYRVFVDGKLKGTTPLLLESLKPGRHTIRIESDSEYLEQAILVKSDISEVLNYEPELKSYTGKLFVNSDPLGAEIYLNSKKVGKTPYVINDLTVGKYSLTVKKSGYFDSKKQVTVKRDITAKESVKLKKAYKIIFDSKLPEEAKVVVVGEAESLSFQGGEEIKLATGEWKVTVSHESFKEQSIDVEIKDSDVTIELSLERYKSQLRLKNIQAGSRIYIDNEEVTGKVEEGLLTLDVGRYDLQVKREGFETFKKEIKVEREKETVVEVSYRLSSKKIMPYKKASTALFVTGGVSAIGFIFLPVGLAINLNAEAIVKDQMSSVNLLDSFNSLSDKGISGYYNEYEKLKIGGAALFYTGLTLSTISLASFIAAIPLYIYYLKLDGKLKSKKGPEVSILLDINEQRAITGFRISI